MQVSFRSKQVPHFLSDSSLTRFKSGVINLLTQKKLYKIGRWLLGSTGATLMLAWNWKLVLATTTGIGLMVFMYQLQEWNWQRRWYHWREFVKSSQGKLAIAVGSGSLAVMGSYIAISLWSEAQNRWLATGLILQGLGTLLTLGLLGWQIFYVQIKNQENQYHQWISALTDADALKRLIAVRNLSNLLEKQQLNSTQIRQLWEYFSLMLSKESELMVRQAILDICQILKKMKP
ncbi:hypothetical protein VB715_11030 [Crocosphaera sp. UHCC 0190]|uniref:hypothetical protein n=1 Tax=Crocosphaera sp. UHCC 0190 TaxID=3110246 RepID=UPI002B202E97|nr:hypothetical protein [Crocosphaera sp. UHCC 0190]MEA5510296.1 hypothetical protein [Crocosphaera sp. UHCC 0190]